MPSPVPILFPMPAEIPPEHHWAWQGRVDDYYRKARICARVLHSPALQSKDKWVRLAKRLVEERGVNDRLIGQAMKWLGYRDRHRKQRAIFLANHPTHDR